MKDPAEEIVVMVGLAVNSLSMNERDKDKLQKQLEEVRGDVDKAEQRQNALALLSSTVKGSVYGVFIGAAVGLGGGMGAVRGEVNVIETLSDGRLDQEAHEWLDQAVAAEDTDPFGKDQMTLRCALATPVLALHGALLGLGIGYIGGVLNGSSRKKK